MARSYSIEFIQIIETVPAFSGGGVGRDAHSLAGELRKVRDRLYRHVQYLSLSFHTKAKTGDLMVRVINDVGMLQDVAVTALLPLMAKALVVAGMAGLMVAMNWKLALLAVSVLPLFWLRTVTLTRRIREVALVGPSGSGKSTLVSLILRLYDHARGA